MRRMSQYLNTPKQNGICARPNKQSDIFKGVMPLTTTKSRKIERQSCKKHQKSKAGSEPPASEAEKGHRAVRAGAVSSPAGYPATKTPNRGVRLAGRIHPRHSRRLQIRRFPKRFTATIWTASCREYGHRAAGRQITSGERGTVATTSRPCPAFLSSLTFISNYEETSSDRATTSMRSSRWGQQVGPRTRDGARRRGDRYRTSVRRPVKPDASRRSLRTATRTVHRRHYDSALGFRRGRSRSAGVLEKGIDRPTQRIYRQIKSGEFPESELRQAYRDNLKYLINKVARLVRRTDCPVVVTARNMGCRPRPDKRLSPRDAQVVK